MMPSLQTRYCDSNNIGQRVFKLQKNGTKVVHIFGLPSAGSSAVYLLWFENGPSSVYTTNRSGLLHFPPFCYEYNYGKAYPTAKVKSAKFHY